MDNANYEFASLLKDIRKSKKMTLVELAELAGTSNSYLSQLENARRNPPKPELLRNIASALAGSDPDESYSIYERLAKKAGYIPDETYAHMMTDEQYAAAERLIQQQDKQKKKEGLSKSFELDALLLHETADDKPILMLRGKPLNHSEITSIQYMLKGILYDRDN